MAKRWRVVMLGSLTLFGVFLGIVLFSQRYALAWNDGQPGFSLRIRNHVASTFKEGYLVPQGEKTFATIGLANRHYYEFRLYEAANAKSGFFEVWSDHDQSVRASLQKGSSLLGKKVRLELESRKIDLLAGDVWYIK